MASLAGSPVRRVCVLLVACLVPLAMLAAPWVHAQESRREFALPAQPLAESLKKVAEAFDLKIVFFSDDAKGVKAPALTGKFSAPQAFDALLAATALEYEYVNSTAVAVRRQSPPVGGETVVERPRSFLGRIGAVLAGALIGSNAFAQESGEAGAQSGGVIEEIIVTAQKRSQNIQDVPISITALTGDDLEIRSFSDLMDLSRATPNLYMTPIGSASPDAASVYIRGVGGGDTYVTSDPGVGIYVDGVFLGRSLGGLLDLLDLERVEVLRGPQGTLFGKNTTGGAINVISKAPTGDGSANLSVTLGNLERIDVAASADLRLSDDLSVKVSGLSKNRDCLYNRQSDRACFGDENTKALRAFLRYKPSEVFTADLIGDITRRDAHILPHVMLEVTDSFAGFTTLTGVYNQLVDDGILGGPTIRSDVHPFNDPSPYANEGTESTAATTDAEGISLHLQYDLGNATLHSISAYREITSDTPASSDGSAADFLNLISFNTAEQFSQEFRIDGSAFNDRLDYTVGLFYFTEDALTEEMLLALEKQPTQVALAAAGITFPFPSIRHWMDQEGESYAGFAHASFDISSNFRVFGGIRYTREKKELFGASHYAFGNLGFRVQDVPLSKFSNYQRDASEDWGAVSPKAGIEWRVSEDIMVYASASRGFRSGGYSGRAQSGNEFVDPYDPEFVWSYEAGLKSQLANDRLRVNLAGFMMDYTDRQQRLLTQSQEGGFVPETTNNGEAEVKGFEFEAAALLTDQLLFEASVGYTDAKFTDEVSVEAGDVFTYTPEWTAALSAEYITPTPNLGGDMTMRVDWNYRGRVNFDPQIAIYNFQKGFGLLNARASWTSEDGKWTAALYGRNLTDKKYFYFVVDAISFFGVAQGTVSDSREYGVTIKRNF